MDEVLVAGNRDMDEAGAWKVANMKSLLMHVLMDNWRVRGRTFGARLGRTDLHVGRRVED